jgi:hypothetical protein
MQVRRGKFPRFTFESIVPIAALQPLQHIPRNGEATGTPLMQHVKILVQHQFGISHKSLQRTAQVNHVAARGRIRAAM